MLIGLSGDLAVDGGFIVPVGRSCPEHNAQPLIGSARTQALDHSPHLIYPKMPRRSQDRERSEQTLSTTTPDYDSHDRIHDHDADLLVANARRHLQITHAHATSWLMSTCRQGGS